MDLGPLQVGVADWVDPYQADDEVCIPGLSIEQQRTQMAIWAMAASNLVAGANPASRVSSFFSELRKPCAGHDVRNMTQETLDILAAPGPLAFDQDPLAVGGRRVRLDPSGRYDTWARPLADGTFAALVFDRGPEARLGATWPHPLCPEDERATTPPSLYFELLGFSGYALVRDAWELGRDHLKARLGETRNEFTPDDLLPAYGHMLLKVSPTPDSEWSDMTHPWECPPWGCEVQRAVKASAEKRWERELKKKSKKEKKMGLGGWLKMQDLDEYDKALRGMGIDSVDALRKAVAAGTMAIVNKLEPDAKRHGRLYRPLRELAAKQ